MSAKVEVLETDRVRASRECAEALEDALGVVAERGARSVAIVVETDDGCLYRDDVSSDPVRLLGFLDLVRDFVVRRVSEG